VNCERWENNKEGPRTREKRPRRSSEEREALFGSVKGFNARREGGKKEGPPERGLELHDIVKKSKKEKTHTGEDMKRGRGGGGKEVNHQGGLLLTEPPHLKTPGKRSSHGR